MSLTEYHEEDARMWLAQPVDDTATVPLWRVRPILQEYLGLRAALRAGGSEQPHMVAFAALRAGVWRHPEGVGPFEFGPNTASGLCAICGPMIGSYRQDWCYYDGRWWVFCLQCCDSWRTDGGSLGAGPSKVALLLEQALREIERLRT